jgi:hypothetical protein
MNKLCVFLISKFRASHGPVCVSGQQKTMQPVNRIRSKQLEEFILSSRVVVVAQSAGVPPPVPETPLSGNRHFASPLLVIALFNLQPQRRDSVSIEVPVLKYTFSCSCCTFNRFMLFQTAQTNQHNPMTISRCQMLDRKGRCKSVRMQRKQDLELEIQAGFELLDVNTRPGLSAGKQSDPCKDPK